MCLHALSQVALAAASACRLRAPRRTVEAPARAWPHGYRRTVSRATRAALVGWWPMMALRPSPLRHLCVTATGSGWSCDQRLRPAEPSAIDESNFRLARSLCDSCRVAVSDGVVARPHRAELSGRARGCAHAAVRLVACAGRCGQPGRAIGPIGRIGYTARVPAGADETCGTDFFILVSVVPSKFGVLYVA